MLLYILHLIKRMGHWPIYSNYLWRLMLTACLAQVTFLVRRCKAGRAGGWIWMLHTVTVASKTQKFFLNAGWRVMPEDEKIKLVQESEAIGQVLEKIRWQSGNWGGKMFACQVFYILGNWSWLKNRYLDNCQSLSNKDCQVWSNWYFQTWRNELFH